LFVTTLCVVRSIHTELAKLYSQKVIYCLDKSNAAVTFCEHTKVSDRTRVHARNQVRDVMRLKHYSLRTQKNVRSELPNEEMEKEMKPTRTTTPYIASSKRIDAPPPSKVKKFLSNI